MKMIRTPGDLAISINGTQFKQISWQRFHTGWELALVLKHTSIPMETNAKLINSIFTPTLTYQCRTWTLTKRLERKIATCKMGCLRRAVNKTRRDKIRNEIREGQRNGRKNTNPTPYRRQRIICFRHLTRMNTNQLAQQA